MEKLIAQLMRLYLMPTLASPELLASHVNGEMAAPVTLVDGAGMTRTLVLAFDRSGHEAEGAHWQRLCDLAHVLQSKYGFPAPGVSISAASGYRLWLSLAAPIPVIEARRFVELLRHAGFPQLDAMYDGVELPPCRSKENGRWSAFINPGMGASFIDEPGLEMQPPPAAQTAFLEQLESIGAEQFGAALQALQTLHPAGTAAPAPSPAHAPMPAPAGELLLRDATLEDIVRHLHALNIEPTFRHLIKPS